MPKQKKCTELIPNIYKVNAENLMLFSWVNAEKQILPTITIEQAIWNFFKFTGVEWDMECAKSTYRQLQKAYFEDCKNEIT
jgi:hypothetical protein